MKQILFAIISIFLVSSTCEKEDGHETITFKNNSNVRIYVKSDNIIFPDTSIIFGDLTKAGSVYMVQPYTTDIGVLDRDGNTYEQLLNHPTQDTLMIFIFDAQIIESTPWDIVKANYLVLKRYDLSLEDLQEMNWTITYP